MSSIIAKKKGKRRYYYVVTSKRVDGKPRIVDQTYLGTAEAVRQLVRNQSAPVPLEGSSRDLGLPGALWQAALSSGAFEALLSVWPAPRKGPSIPHFLLLAAFHRIASPGPKTRVADWYSGTVLPRLWGFPASNFSSQSFWNRFDQITVHGLDPKREDPSQDELDRAQQALLEVFRAKDLVGPRVLACDTTNFHTWIATSNLRSALARHGRDKQKGHNLRQVGLSYALDARHGLSLCHHVYPGNCSDSDELPAALQRLGRLLDGAGIARESVTLVLDKGSAALASTLELGRQRLDWVAPLPWNQAPAAVRALPDAALRPVGGGQGGVRAAARRELVHGAERLCVLQHSSDFAAEQMHSAFRTLDRVTQRLRGLARELAKPGARRTEAALRRKIDGWLAGNFATHLLNYELERQGVGWQLTYRVRQQGLGRLAQERFGRTTLATSHLDWSAGQVVRAYGRQQQVERVFQGLKGGEWVGWGPMYHWTDSKIRVHAFYCLLGVSLLLSAQRRAERAWPGLTMEQLKRELEGIQQYELLYPRLGSKGNPRVATVLSKRNATQQALAAALGLDSLLQKGGG